MKTDHREQFAGIVEHYRELTGGLTIRCRQRGAQAVIVLQDRWGIERALSDCGDGLRDLLSCVLHTVLLPDHDLAFDELGIRLHPEAQRRLVSFLDAQSERRAIWVGSHHGVFIGAAQVKLRLFVSRDEDADRSRIEIVASPEDLRRAQHELGWRPEDALLASHVLFVEGPSDRAVAESVLGDILWRGGRPSVLVAELGGSGAVWSKELGALRSQLELLRRIAPHASFSILIDADEHTETERARVQDAATRNGVGMRILARSELESFFLAPAVVASIVRRLSTSVDHKDASDEEIRAHLDESLKRPHKASRVLEEVCQASAGVAYHKVLGAQAAVEALRELDPVGYAELLDEFRCALFGEPAQ